VGSTTRALRLPAAAALLLAPQLAPARAAQRLDLDFELEERYDDNITDLSDRQIDRLEDDPQSGCTGSSNCRFLIESPDDFITIGHLDARWTTRPLKRRETVVGAGLDGWRYARNPVKDYNKLGLFAEQELTASRKHLATLRGWVSRIPSYYVRQLTDDAASFEAGETIRTAADYERTDYGARWEQQIVADRLRTFVGYEVERRDYDASFDERDSDTRRLTLKLRGHVPGPRLRLELVYGHGTRDAEGDRPDTPIPDDDVSYDYDSWGLSVGVPWRAGRGGGLSFGASTEDRDFTTDNLFDTLRYGRTDERTRQYVAVEQKLMRDLELSAEWRHRENDAEFLPGFESNKDIVDYDDNRYTVGLRYRVRVRSREPEP